jgi:sulfur transfer complex TusBCD TusB component (DsrH family)
LLLGDAAAAAGSDVGRQLLVLGEDMPASVAPIATATVIGYDEFVELTVNHQPIVTWR